MTVALVLAVVAVAEALALVALFHALRSQARQHGRREDALLDKVCHLAGQPWNEAPAEQREPAALELVDPHVGRFTHHPLELT